MDTQQQTKYRILLLGDSCLDVYTYGTVTRISPEAPVPIFKYSYEEERPGMAANVQLNLEKLGCDVDFVMQGYSVKNRLIDIRSKQQVLRMDEDTDSEPIKPDRILNDMTATYDAIVISDYAKGAITVELIKWLRTNFSGPIFLDTKIPYLAEFDGIFVKINELEYQNAKSHNNSLIVTLGARGAMYNDEIFDGVEVSVTDVCGAGDTFLAAVAVEFLKTNDIKAAIRFAIRASAVTVQHIGCYAPAKEEIECV